MTEEKKVVIVGGGGSPIRGVNKSRLTGVMLAAAAMLGGLPSGFLDLRVGNPAKKKNPEIRREKATYTPRVKRRFSKPTEKDFQALEAAEQKRARKAAKLEGKVK